jgi:hypothetical protein
MRPHLQTVVSVKVQDRSGIEKRLVLVHRMLDCGDAIYYSGDSVTILATRTLRSVEAGTLDPLLEAPYRFIPALKMFAACSCGPILDVLKPPGSLTCC